MVHPEIPLLPATVPVPTTVTVSGKWLTPVNVAVTSLASVIDTVHVSELPLHAPVQPVNVWPVPGVAVNVTDVESEYECEQSAVVAPQSMPAGLD